MFQLRSNNRIVFNGVPRNQDVRNEKVRQSLQIGIQASESNRAHALTRRDLTHSVNMEIWKKPDKKSQNLYIKRLAILSIIMPLVHMTEKYAHNQF